jgi:hypothetical protein
MAASSLQTAGVEGINVFGLATPRLGTDRVNADPEQHAALCGCTAMRIVLC